MVDRQSSNQFSPAPIQRRNHRRDLRAGLSAFLLAVAAAALPGCGLSEGDATNNAYLASLNGLNIDQEVGRSFEEVQVTPPMTFSSAVQEAMDDLRKSGDLAVARARLQALVDESPRDASAFCCLGRVLSDLKLYEESAKASREAVKLRTDLPDLWLDLAASEFTAGHRDEAFNAARTAAAIDPTSPSTLKRAGRVFYQLGRNDAAELTLNTLTQLSPEDPGAWHDRGRNLAAAGKAGLAMACFDKSIALYAGVDKPSTAQSKSHAEALTDFGIVAQWDHADEKAKILFQKAVEIDPTFAMAWHKLSQQQSQPRLKPLYDVDSAIRSANTAVSLSQAKNADYLHQLAKVYAMGGNLDRAVVAEEQANLLVKDKYARTLEMLKKLQADRSRVFDPEQFEKYADR